MNAFDAYLKQHTDFSNEEAGIISSYFREEKLAREEQLVCQGFKYNKIVFVGEGILRLYVIDAMGEEVVKNFIEPGNFFADIESLERNRPAVINVSAVTDCTLYTLLKTDSAVLSGKIPRWNLLVMSGAMEAMNNMIRKQEFLRIGNAVDQYKYFVENFPSLAMNVPLKYIASYLRITQSSLSRIRKQGW